VINMVAAAVIATGVASAASSAMSSGAASSAVGAAASAQESAAQAGIAEQRRQFDALQKLMQPYVGAGTGALTGQQDLLGLNGNAAQQKGIDSIKNGSMYNELNQQGQTAILQNASATGGLRGGNTQGALAQFSPQLLQSLINNQYSNLSGLSTMGENAAAGVGAAGQNTGNAITQLLQQQGAAQAGGILGKANIQQQLYGQYGQIAGGVGSGLMKAIGGF
jgi:hypothetical protein